MSRRKAPADIVQAISGSPSREVWFTRLGLSWVPINLKGVLVVAVGATLFAALAFAASKSGGLVSALFAAGALLDVFVVFLVATSRSR